MKLAIDINGAEESIEILQPAPACAFRFAGEERDADVQIVEPCVYSILMDGRSYEARVEERPEGLVVVIDGRRFEVEVRDPRRRSAQRGKHGGAGPQQVTSPMPGRVVRLLVAQGDEVIAGQGLVVVEAMKMQNELKAPRNGRVLTLTAREGATIAAGEVLAVIE